VTTDDKSPTLPASYLIPLNGYIFKSVSSKPHKIKWKPILYDFYIAGNTDIDNPSTFFPQIIPEISRFFHNFPAFFNRQKQP
jgi:hypothetical protein